MDRERNRVANGLDIPPEMRAREFALLSGGEKTRVNLARLILEDTDILLLDEPTNHLDLRATEWLEDYILHFRGTVLAISHDRYFLDTVAQRCIEIVDGRAEFYSGNYSFYVVERQRRFDEQLRKYEKDQAKIEQLQRAAAKLHLWAFMGNDKLHKRAFSMEKRIERLNQTERPREARKLHAAFKERNFAGDEVVAMDGLTKGFEGRTLFADLSAIVAGGERVAIIGDNGTGKSTLIKLIVGEEEPDAGWVRRGPSVRMAYLPQIIRFNDTSRSALDTMIYDCRCSPQEARDSLGAFGFSGEDALKEVGTLSGGEQSRLRLCMLMRSDVNLLILDEPTNHLDIASREWMEGRAGGLRRGADVRLARQVFHREVRHAHLGLRGRAGDGFPRRFPGFPRVPREAGGHKAVRQGGPAPAGEEATAQKGHPRAGEAAAAHRAGDRKAGGAHKGAGRRGRGQRLRLPAADGDRRGALRPQRAA